MSTLTEEQIEKCVDELIHIRAQEDAVLNRLRTKGTVTDEKRTKSAGITPNSTGTDHGNPATGAVTEKVFESYIEALEGVVTGRQALIRDLRDLRVKGMLTVEQIEEISDTLTNNAPDGTRDGQLRAELMEQARKDLVEYARGGSDSGEWHWPHIIPRSEAIRRLQEKFAQELIRSDPKGFFYSGFKGLDHMTNKQLSKRLSDKPSLPDCIVWYDLDFELLFGNWHEVKEPVLRDMGLLREQDDDEDDEDEYEREG